MAQEKKETIEQVLARIKAQDAEKAAAEKARIEAAVAPLRAARAAREAEAAKQLKAQQDALQARRDELGRAEEAQLKRDLRATFQGTDEQFEKNFPSLALAWRTSEAVRQMNERRAASARMFR